MASPILSHHNWLAGTLELTSKVRYGLTSRGVPRFRFVPYDRRFQPLAVGCSARELFYNVYAIVEPAADGKTGTLVQTLGQPTADTECQVLLATYAADSQKALRKVPDSVLAPASPHEDLTQRLYLPGTTFHIDPPGCRDVDDTITFTELTPGSYGVAIHIADVAAWIPAGSPLDQEAAARATSFYSPNGVAVAPMLPRALGEDCASLLPGPPRPTVSFLFSWIPGTPPDLTKGRFHETMAATTLSYTYEQASNKAETDSWLDLLCRLCSDLGRPSSDPHVWIETMMRLYNTEAGKVCRTVGAGILRRSKGKNAEKLAALEPLLEEYPELARLSESSAEFCPASAVETRHVGIGTEAYAYASSPLRRYADLVNQRILKEWVRNQRAAPVAEDLIRELNRREKQAKTFSRDLFFLMALAGSSDQESKDGLVLDWNPDIRRLAIWVPAWNRRIKARVPADAWLPKPGSCVALTWYEDRGKPNWKERIVFRVAAAAGL